MHYRTKSANWRHLFCGFAFLLSMLAACSDRPWSERLSLNGGDGEGIGGTGIIGIVADFGSIIVNDLRVGIDETAVVFVDGELGSVSDLRRGQLVFVEAFGSATSLVASRVSIRHEVIGPVTGLAPVLNEMLVLDQRIKLAPELGDLSTLNVGDWVAVSGLRRPDGTIYGTRIDRREDSDIASVYGRYGLDSGNKDHPVRIAGVNAYGLSANEDWLGREVLLRGRLDEGRLTAAGLTPQIEIPFDGRLRNLSIASFVDRRDPQARLRGLTVKRRPDVRSLQPDSIEVEDDTLMIMDGHIVSESLEFQVERVREPAEASKPNEGETEADANGNVGNVPTSPEERGTSATGPSNLTKHHGKAE